MCNNNGDPAIRKLIAWEGVPLKVTLEKIPRDREEQALLRCHEVSGQIKSIVRFIHRSGETLSVVLDGRIHRIPLQDIYFVEAVDNRTFAYTVRQVYELKCRLYEFECQYGAGTFFRCSRSFVVNLLKIENVRPILNGRFSATMSNGEEVIISRQYVPELKERLAGTRR